MTSPGRQQRIKVLTAVLRNMRKNYPTYRFDTPGPQDIFDYQIGNLWKQDIDGYGTTIAVIEGWDFPGISRAVAAFDKTYGLPNPQITTIFPSGRVAETYKTSLNDLALMRVVDGGKINTFTADVLPDVEFRPVREREGAQVLARPHAALIELPQLGIRSQVLFQGGDAVAGVARAVAGGRMDPTRRCHQRSGWMRGMRRCYQRWPMAVP